MSDSELSVPRLELKKKRKKLPLILGSTAVIAALIAALGFSRLDNPEKEWGNEVSVAINPANIPADFYLQYVRDEIAPDLGLTLNIEHFDDYTEINRATHDGEIAANFAQNAPFLSDQLTAFDFNLEAIGEYLQSTAGVFSAEIASLEDIPQGATVSIRDDPAGQARGILALNDLGLITLKDASEDLPQISDIAENPLELEFMPVSIGSIGRTYEEVDLIAGYYSDVQAAVPTESIIGIADVREGWGLLLVVNSDNINDPGIQLLHEAISDPRATEYLLNYPDESLRQRSVSRS